MAAAISSLKAWNKEYRLKNEVWRKRLSEPLPSVLKDKLVLELGVGNGKTLQKILRQKPRAVKAVDFSPVAIRLCREKFKGENIVEFIEADVCRLPFADSFFDVVACYHILGHLLAEDRKIAAKEIERVLKKKGLLLFEDFAVGDLRFGKGKMLEKNTFLRGNGITYHYFTVSEVRKLFKLKGPVKKKEKRLKLAGMEVARKEIIAELKK